MSTLEFVSASADGISEISAPLVTVAALVSALGTHPALTIPMVCGQDFDVDDLWRRLAEPAEFYGHAVPDVAALRQALRTLLTEAETAHGPVTLAANVMAVEVDGQPQFVVSATVIDPIRSDSVALAARPGPVTEVVPTWRRMAARTSSHAEADLLQRDLERDGYVDEVPADTGRIGAPRLGALVYDTAQGKFGLGADRLTLLSAAGLLEECTVSDDPFELASAHRVWWVSPLFEAHPVTSIGGHHFPASGVRT